MNVRTAAVIHEKAYFALEEARNRERVAREQLADAIEAEKQSANST